MPNSKTKLISLTLKLIFAFGLFTIPFIAFYPDPVFFDLTRDIRCGASADSVLGHGTADANIITALILFALFIVVMLAISVYLSHKLQTMLLKPKNQVVQGFMILILFFSGIASGFFFNVAMGDTHYANCYNKASERSILEKNWRKEIRAYTGFNNLLGVDLVLK
ncbi:hypothetical protein [Sulfurospirillum halorespirans]|nr:hypothetical protein [Sulfurospirillum halorespirans]